MIHRSIQQINDMVNGKLVKEKYVSQGMIKGVSIDTRSIAPGNLFVPIKGERFNGHQFLADAVKSGAAAALWCEDEPMPAEGIPLIIVKDTLEAIQQLAKEYRRQLPVKVIGVTGSNGKTSTKDILAALLGTQYRTQKTTGNLNNHLGVPLTLLSLAENTEMAVVEMGMSGLGEIKLLSTIASPNAAIITNISEAHLTELKTKEMILQAKLEILSGLRENGLFIYNGDDPYLSRECRILSMLAELSSSPVLQIATFGCGADNDIAPASCTVEKQGVTFTLQGEESCPPFFLPMLGKHQMYNALAAAAAAKHFGVSYDNIRQGLLQVEATGMRNELIEVKHLTIMNDSYKSNPTSLRAALDTLYQLTGYQQKFVVLGDMNGIGNEMETIRSHREIGEELDAEQISCLFTIGSLAEHIASAAKKHFPEERIFSFQEQERDELIAKLKMLLTEETIVLVKSSRKLQLENIVNTLLKSTA
ncbi:UDP-N-acetylmuramoyl-tripeptide--D-alanyl-D-alanine ligase [Evansella caseinilytica]|uniref:UDP-N-acetylmuramoyl-tripeptide--D-alanyl-D-alanine ligase n=1 Tax=Evansella caseinilytica TaxID=1503961 RepID=A0A1H3TUP5_9BACI|nr:UDP-N-acetylmuramoyl-tripeptide--D-alanyl-D-alanine ligase [Evansella caseinilytica]SDZ53963.1 UDP-N-acetylmuramoyl-tripeptide--D-alanyl-D-alanine ligase [Evansella caseinilytica]